VSELTQATAQGVVFGVVERVCKVIAPADGVFAVGGTVRFIGDQVDFAEELALVVLEFADHHWVVQTLRRTM